jgi:hypothetical protein
MNDEDELARFYSAIRGEIAVASFLDQYARINQFVVESGLVEDRRLARGRLKRLRDEVQPVAHFVARHAAASDFVQFPLDTGPIDCTICHGVDRVRLVQITVAQAKERFNIMRLLNRIGQTWRFLGVADDEGKDAFEVAMKRGQVMYSTEEAHSIIVRAIGICLQRKQDSRGADTLLIDAPLEYLPAERWQVTLPKLCEIAERSSFADVFVTSREVVLHIKPGPILAAT